MSRKPSKEQIDAMYAAHEREQVLYIARNTTPDQRVRWLENAVELFRQVAADREKKGLPVFLKADIDQMK